MINFIVKIKNYPETAEYWVIYGAGFVFEEWFPISQTSAEITADLVDGESVSFTCICHNSSQGLGTVASRIYTIGFTDGATYVWDVANNTFTKQQLNWLPIGIGAAILAFIFMRKKM